MNTYGIEYHIFTFRWENHCLAKWIDHLESGLQIKTAKMHHIFWIKNLYLRLLGPPLPPPPPCVLDFIVVYLLLTIATNGVDVWAWRMVLIYSMGEIIRDCGYKQVHE